MVETPPAWKFDYRTINCLFLMRALVSENLGTYCVKKRESLKLIYFLATSTGTTFRACLFSCLRILRETKLLSLAWICKRHGLTESYQIKWKVYIFRLNYNLCRPVCSFRYSQKEVTPSTG